VYRPKHPLLLHVTPQDPTLESLNTSVPIAIAGSGMYMACQFALCTVEDISDIITDELLEKYPLLINYNTKVTSDLSMISTKLDVTKMYLHWNNEYWLYRGIINGSQVKSNKIYCTKEREPIYTTYPITNLTKSDTNQFPGMVEKLSEEERKALKLVYKCYLCREDAVDYTEMYNELRFISQDIQNKLIRKGMCILGHGKKMIPNTIRPYTQSHMQFLNEFMPQPPKKKIVCRGAIATPYKKTVREMMQDITCYDETENYMRYFAKFHDPDKSSVPKEYINFIGTKVFLDLLDTVDPNGKYNVHSFLEFVNVVGYSSSRTNPHTDTNVGLLVAIQAKLKYKTSNIVQNRIFTQPMKPIIEFNGIIPLWDEYKLKQQQNDTELYTDLTLSLKGFKWILKNMDKSISQNFLGHFIAKPTSEDNVYSVKCSRYIEKNVIVQLEYLCRVCVQFGNQHTNHTKHSGMQLEAKLASKVLCSACKDSNTPFNFGVCQGVGCGIDVYANVCDWCAKTTNIMHYLCLCHGQPAQRRCKPGKHTGYPIVPIGTLSNKVCDVCSEYQGTCRFN
jgi:hypothetical protein